MKDLYKTICERIKADKDAKREERELMLDDQRFAAGDQWPMQIKRKREIEGRPIQTINRIPAFLLTKLSVMLVKINHQSRFTLAKMAIAILH